MMPPERRLLVQHCFANNRCSIVSVWYQIGRIMRIQNARNGIDARRICKSCFVVVVFWRFKSSFPTEQKLYQVAISGYPQGTLLISWSLRFVAFWDNCGQKKQSNGTKRRNQLGGWWTYSHYRMGRWLAHALDRVCMIWLSDISHICIHT